MRMCLRHAVCCLLCLSWPALSSDLVKAGGSVAVEADEIVDQAVAVGGNVTVDGTVRKDAVAIGGSVFLGPGAVVGGDALSVGGAVEKADGAQIKGATFEISIPSISSIVREIFKGIWGAWFWGFRIVTFAGFLALAVLLVMLFPRQLSLVMQEVRAGPVRAAAWGIAGVLVIVPAMIVLAVSVVGIPLIPLAGLLIAVGFLAGYIAVAMLIGERIAALAKSPEVRIVGRTAMGVTVLWMLGWLPVLGWLVKAAVLILGFGGFFVALRGAAKRRRAAL